MPILWALGALGGGVLLLLVVLTLTHMGSDDRPVDTDVAPPSTVAPAQLVVPPQPCFPFEASC